MLGTFVIAFLLQGFFSGAAHAATPIQPTPAATPAWTTVYPRPLKLEEMTDMTLCGSTSTKPPRRMCFGTPDGVTLNDTIGHLKSFVMGPGHLCGLDERGVQCWKTEGQFEKPIQEILSVGDASRARINRSTICVPQVDQTIHCYTTNSINWLPEGGTQTVRHPREIFGPYKDLRDFQITEELIYVLDGDRVTQQRFAATSVGEKGAWVPQRSYPKARSINITWDTLCVLSDDGLDCTRGRTEQELKSFHVGGAWKTVPKIFENGGYNVVCAVDAAKQPLCVRLGLEDGDVTDATPSELKAPGIKVLDFKSAGDHRCALVSTATDRRALYCGAWQTMTKVEVLGDDVVDFNIAIDSACAVNSKGLVNCFYNGVYLDSPLPEDGSPVYSTGKCRWNNSRFHCSSVLFEAELEEFKNVVGAFIDPQDVTSLPCVLYDNASGIRSVKCLGMAGSLLTEPPALDPDTTRMTMGYRYACAYGGTNVKCWGDSLGGVEPPNLTNVSKMQFGNDFGCANDRFGLACWGRDLETRGLSIPNELKDIGAVLDFAVGNEYVCAVTGENTLKCWGEGSGAAAPPLRNVSAVMARNDATCAASDEGTTCWGDRSEALSTAHAKAVFHAQPGANRK